MLHGVTCMASCPVIVRCEGADCKGHDNGGPGKVERAV